MLTVGSDDCDKFDAKFGCHLSLFEVILEAARSRKLASLSPALVDFGGTNIGLEDTEEAVREKRFWEDTAFGGEQLAEPDDPMR